ncbi:uncharacterized protein E0L32_002897 [Thyridium curvatum]|uniref:Uncharacterized protein n=1 Tax=Thyridium curvatum TaxID=1093900 RepID=A0A507BEQ0_9PEZI|nr:uncharacterized protein E0L32_002897 [Thyridium curvatum]TPX17796.1 hypothetical protein E0L32_002897 [Thyridium curvatum]
MAAMWDHLRTGNYGGGGGPASAHAPPGRRGDGDLMMAGAAHHYPQQRRRHHHHHPGQQQQHDYYDSNYYYYDDRDSRPRKQARSPMMTREGHGGGSHTTSTTAEPRPRRRAGGAPGYTYEIRGGPAPARPPREFMEQQQQQQQQQHHRYLHDSGPAPGSHHHGGPPPPPRHSNHQYPPQRGSSFRPTSSLYSQPSPINTNFDAQQQPQRHPRYQQHHYNYQPQQPRYAHAPTSPDEVSPPSSPEYLAPGLHQSQEDVSPIDDTPELAAQQLAQMNINQQGTPPQGKSNIPMMRRERRQTQNAAANTLRETKSRERMRQHAHSQAGQHPQQPPQDPRTNSMSSQRGYKGGPVLWDPNSGELTSSNKGRPSQVKPAEYAKGLGTGPDSLAGARAALKPTTKTADQPRAQAPTSFGDRMKKMARNMADATRNREPSPAAESATDPAAGAFVANRPAWNGASGRTTLVAPVRDNQDVAPLKIPPKSSKRTPVSSPVRTHDVGNQHNQPGGLNIMMGSPPVSPPAGGETPGRETIRRIVPSSEMAPQQQPSTPQAGAVSYPSPPVSAGLNHRDSLPSQQPAAPSPSPTSQQPIKRKPAPAGGHQQQDSVSSVYSQSDPYNYKHYAAQPPPPQSSQQQQQLQDPWQQPPSRFSVTTYDATPRESLDEFAPSDAPPVPAMPNNVNSSPLAGNRLQESMMERRRPPKLGHADSASIRGEPIVISLKDQWNTPGGGAAAHERKPVPRGVARAATDSSAAARPQSGISVAGSVHKMLPPAPPETTAKDRVTQLNAQLASLAQRRVNIARSIKQMTELMPQDNIMDSAEVIHKRELEKRKVEGLKLELSEVQREEYELGLKLHRAYKRMDQNADFEPTTLWVRRVTG